MSESREVSLPMARLRPVRARSWAWLLPLAAVAAALVFARAAWLERGPELTLFAPHGHGLGVGDPLLHRGIVVGEVRSLELVPALEQVEIRVVLDPAAERLARVGSRFWVERPSLTLDRLRGVDTILGGRHLAVLPGPGDGPVQHEFVCLAAPPVLTLEEEGGLELVLEAPRTFGLGPGAPITYRQIRVGSVVGVALSSDATVVEVRCVVRADYAPLVREDSRFWEDGGLETGFELLEGFRLELDSLSTFFTGGIAFATPTRPGPPARTGRRFALHAEPEEAWLAWSPALAVGGAPVASTGGVVPVRRRPRPLRVRLLWEAGIFGRNHARTGWALATDRGLLAPSDLLRAPEDAEEPALELLGRRFTPAIDDAGPSTGDTGGVGLLALDLGNAGTWPADRARDLTEPEDCVVVADPGEAPTAIGAARLQQDGGGFAVDPSIHFEATWHGAPVIARADGFLVGLLLVDGERARVVPVAATLAR